VTARCATIPISGFSLFYWKGSRFEADVELQTVLVPHLISLPKGFSSVRQELYRLQLEDWYRFFDHIPLWPMYFNGQGAACRKLSTRYVFTTQQVRGHQSHVGTLLATFLLFIYPKMKGKQGRQWAKPIMVVVDFQ
jgi:hypothetical protein